VWEFNNKKTALVCIDLELNTVVEADFRVHFLAVLKPAKLGIKHEEINPYIDVLIVLADVSIKSEVKSMLFCFRPQKFDS